MRNEQVVLSEPARRQRRTASPCTIYRSSAERADLTLGTIYKTLTRLEDKGLVASYIGAPTAERGGRRTRCYTVTAAGKRSLEATFKALRHMAAGLDVGLEPT